jgi:hypothetical protein
VEWRFLLTIQRVTNHPARYVLLQSVTEVSLYALACHEPSSALRSNVQV